MSFYTNVNLIGNNLLYIGYEDGQRIQRKFKFSPTLYVVSNQITDYKTLDGRYAKPIRFNTVGEARDFKDKYKDVENFEVHGYAGFVGLVICGFVLNGYPASGYSVGAMWDGTTYATINPLGQFLGAIIMFVVLGLIPGYIIAKVLNGMGKLRIPREVEIAGLDYEMMESAKEDEKAVSSATR